MSNYINQLVHIFVSIKKPVELAALLRDLLTPAELRELAVRWQIVQELNAGKSQRQVAKQFSVGIATVGRGARVLQESTGGFKQVLKHVKQ